MKHENENIEYKLQFTDNIYKSVIAFANTKGGIIQVGVDNEGNEVGLKDFDNTYTQITNGIRDAIYPDVTIFIKYTEGNNKTININIKEGTSKPYRLKSKGLTSQGVFVRHGASSVPASEDMIIHMISSNNKERYELMESPEQELTFNYAKKIFSKSDLEFSENKYAELGMIKNGFFTNLALLISDQCRHSVKVGVFSDNKNTLFIDNKEFKGSVFRQIDEAFAYIMQFNKTAFYINNIYREEKQDYIPANIRECIVNAVIHRDYSFSGSIIINLNDSSAEFISLGKLADGLTVKDIISGTSQQRNEKLAEMFLRLRIIEAYGTGLKRIFASYDRYIRKPEILLSPNSFKIILRNMNKTQIFEPSQEEKILNYIDEFDKITEKEIETLLNVRSTRAYSIAQKMCKDNKIEKIGKGQDKYYILKQIL